MSGTIHSYLRERGDISFAECPMNDVDSLVLCQFAYLKFDGLVPGIKEDKPSVTLRELDAHPAREGMFADERFAKDNRELFEEMLAGKRFGSMKLNCHINVIEKEQETQFAAVTFILDDGTIYVAFRGTDETIVGWKEDFNMAFLYPVPGQVLSVKYLNMVTERFHNDFYVGGHSKGGNLAVYSAMNCADNVRKRIIRVYCMDGPGFKPEVLESCHYEKIADRVVKLLPHSSMVGMIFEWDTRYRVVESRHFGLAQHNPYNWKVKDGEFVAVDAIYERARLIDNTINEWIISLDEQNIKLFVDTLYSVITVSDAEDLISMSADWKRSMIGVVTGLKGIDRSTSKMLLETVKALFELAGIKFKEEMANKRHPKRKTEAVPPTA